MLRVCTHSTRNHIASLELTLSQRHSRPATAVLSRVPQSLYRAMTQGRDYGSGVVSAPIPPTWTWKWQAPSAPAFRPPAFWVPSPAPTHMKLEQRRIVRVHKLAVVPCRTAKVEGYGGQFCVGGHCRRVGEVVV